MKARTVVSFVVALLVVMTVAVGATAQSPVSEFDTVLADRFIATDSITTPSLTVAGGVTAVSSSLGASSATSLSVTNDASIGARLLLAKGSQQTVAANSVISSTSSFVDLTASGAVTVTGIYTPTALNGQVLTLVNAGTNAITIPDSGLQRQPAAVVLGQYDTVTYVSYLGVWTQVSTSNN